MLLFLIVVSLPCAFAQDPEVDTIYGRVSGKSITLSDGSVIDSYLGIPFATPPIGNLRFTLPQEPEPWDETFFADDLSNACVQNIVTGIYLSHAGFRNFSEDCLNLNIYSPQRENPDELLPVMVWIHGGNYQAGAGFGYPGYFLAQKGVVVVTINYRLGVFGFAYTGDGVISGNMGLMDQVQALQFVQGNIAAFGGDPNQVTISGESAGAASVGLLEMSPFATGLFHNAILQSGCEFAGFALHSPEMKPENFIFDIAQRLDCPTVTSEEMVECLRLIDARRLDSAVINCTEGYECFSGFRPVIDGTILPDLPEILRESGNYNTVPEMIGVTENEANIFLAADPRLDDNGLNRTAFNDQIWQWLSPQAITWPDPTRLDDVFKAIEFYYTDWPYYYDPERNRDMLGKMYTDGAFGFPVDKQAKFHSGDGLSVYYYIFNYVLEYSKLEEWIGAYHASELEFLFGWPSMDENQMAFDHSQANPYLNTTYSVRDAEYSDYLMTLWTNFAKFGNPTPDVIPGPNNTALTWPLFVDGDFNYLNLAPEPSIRKDYRQQSYAFWTEYLKYLIDGDEFIVSFPVLDLDIDAEIEID